MTRNIFALTFAATTLAAQQVRPVPTPMPLERVEAQQARVEAMRVSQLDRAETMRVAQEARVEALQAQRAVTLADRAYGMGQGFGQGISVGIGQGIGQGISTTISSNFTPLIRTYSNRAPEPWAPQDPADSLYRQAQQAMNRGDYRRAASLFKDVTAKQPNSVYAADAMYWQAFSLYRIGGNSELQEALTVLDARKSKYPSGRTRGDADPALATRIAGVLSARGMGDKDLVKRALTEGSGVCDSEDQSVRSEALSALRQTDPEEAMSQAKKILGRKDECSVQLRRSALWMIANKKDAEATATLVNVAKNDPSLDLRAEATGFLGSIGTDDAFNALEQLLKSDDERIQRAAVRALTSHPNPRARIAMRALVENNSANEQLRITAIDAYNSDRSTLDDATWLRSIYTKVDNARIKARIVGAVARIGGDQNESWLMGLARNEDESIEVRQSALRTVARTADINNLNKFYDGLSARPLRTEVINVLGDRKEPEATDKLLDIARSGTDPEVRRSALNALARKKDARTTKLLLDIISGENTSGKKP